MNDANAGRRSSCASQVFQPAGTPIQQRAWMRGIEKQLRREAAELRREVQRIERVAARIERDRLSGRTVSSWDLVDALNSDRRRREDWPNTHSSGSHYIGRLAGFAGYCDRERGYRSTDDLRDVLLGDSTVAEIASRSSRASAPIAKHSEAPAPAPAAAESKTSWDPLVDAVAIARSLKCDVIDWSTEPLTDYERRTRAKFLALKMQDESGRMKISSLAMQHRPCASDLADAAREAWRIDRIESQRNDAREAREALEDEAS
jgi:hypothetical protein